MAIEIIQNLTGNRPLDVHWSHECKHQKARSRSGGFLYDADAYDDDLPYWVKVDKTDHLVIPYTLDCNDMRFVSPQGFNSGDQFFLI